MPTQCSSWRFDFACVEGRAVVASFEDGRLTSDGGALLLGATDRVLALTRRLAACFKGGRDAAYTEHAVETLVMQRVVGIALGYEDLIDHDQLRHDPVLAVLAGKLAAHRADCAPLAGKSTLNRLELSQAEPTRYHKIAADPAGGEAAPLAQRCRGRGGGGDRPHHRADPRPLAQGAHPATRRQRLLP